MIKKANLKWISAKEGGRNSPIPVGTKYSPIILFENMEGYWSCTFTATKVKNGTSKVKIEFLVDNAPLKHMKKGNKFELYEGSKKVACGEIL